MAHKPTGYLNSISMVSYKETGYGCSNIPSHDDCILHLASAFICLPKIAADYQTV